MAGLNVKMSILFQNVFAKTSKIDSCARRILSEQLFIWFMVAIVKLFIWKYLHNCSAQPVAHAKLLLIDNDGILL